jgi:hypothetical protein
MHDLSRYGVRTLLEWRDQLFYEDLSPDEDIYAVDTTRLARLSLEQLARWLALTAEILTQLPVRWIGEGGEVEHAQEIMRERLQALADSGLRVLPRELTGIPLDPRVIPPEFRQPMTHDDSKTEHTFSADGGAL